uniref:C-type lectin domain-containing protein n=1 Tax=Anser cygnoides TaxID=8845 RepID=A0A8B9EFD8_ANSCY
MAVTTVYTDLEMPQGPGGIPQLPKPPGRRWYWAILGAGWIGAAVLAGIVLWLLQRHGAEGCWLCPTGWQPFATKCYRISAKTLPWKEAGGDCKDRRAELVMLKSVEEKDFIGAMSKEIAGSWMGLSTIPTQGEGWTWMDGSPLQDDLLQVMGERRANACASMWKGQLRSHTCGTPLHWICQKEATKI